MLLFALTLNEFTYIWKLETEVMRVPVAYTYQYILLQLIVSSVRPAVSLPFLGHNHM